MRIFRCNKCGCIIPEKEVLTRIESLSNKGHLSKKTVKEAKKELQKEKPYISCHNPDCGGLLREINRESLQANLKSKMERKEK